MIFTPEFSSGKKEREPGFEVVPLEVVPLGFDALWEGKKAVLNPSHHSWPPKNSF